MILRFVVFALVLIVVISILRAVIGLIAKAFSDLFLPPQNRPSSNAPEIPLTGELKRDPVCGIYVPATTSFKKTVNGEVVYFCSAECRDKYV
ncbi:MAG: YHS domain-containing protein [Bryobacterales bacterium]|nr:YHS domain-containing protein [Bryobacterales bacterium]